MPALVAKRTYAGLNVFHVDATVVLTAYKLTILGKEKNTMFILDETFDGFCISKRSSSSLFIQRSLYSPVVDVVVDGKVTPVAEQL